MVVRYQAHYLVTPLVRCLSVFSVLVRLAKTQLLLGLLHSTSLSYAFIQSCRNSSRAISTALKPSFISFMTLVSSVKLSCNKAFNSSTF